MNRNVEAIEYIHSIKNLIPKEHYQTIKEALDRQIPQGTEYYPGDETCGQEIICPHCSAMINYSDDVNDEWFSYSYCWNCGQRITQQSYEMPDDTYYEED